jgi:hypothetical protein
MDPLGFNDCPCERNEVECDNLPLAKEETAYPKGMLRDRRKKALLAVTVIEFLFNIRLTIIKFVKILYW